VVAAGVHQSIENVLDKRPAADLKQRLRQPA
jgi:hypothetical protein